MPDYSVEELVINDSFINYCLQQNEADGLYWKQHLNIYPLEKEKIEEAKKIVLGLNIMLKREYIKSKASGYSVEEKTKFISKIFSVKKLFQYAAAVAAVLIVVLITRKMTHTSYNTANKSISQTAPDTVPDRALSFKTSNGEKKMVILSDNTKIWLNAGSSLRVDKGFGEQNRKVYLIGEALFHVIHNKSLPFIVHINNCEIKDLGTVFNVKAYLGDKQSETSLIRGKVEIQITSSKRKILLTPNQKAVINNHDEQVKEKENTISAAGGDIELLSLSYSQKDSSVIETAWAQNRLEIVNEDFYEMKEKLERWFDVKIFIKDDEVGKYPFTATFEKENIQQVLHALQYAYHFNYTIKNNEVSISE